MHKCPVCKQEFEELYVVHSTSLEPFTGVSAMEGLSAWGGIDVPKTIICQQGSFVHFRFLTLGKDHLVQMKKFDQQKLAEQHDFHQQNPQICQHDGCAEMGIPCYLDWIHDEPDEWLCPEHAPKGGYCCNCGLFNAGVESFDFNPNGLCEACQDALEGELEDGYDEDDDLYDGWDYPPGWADPDLDPLDDDPSPRYIGPGSEQG